MMERRMPIRRLPAVVVLVAILSSAGAVLARPVLDAPRMQQLGHYEVVTFADPAGGGINKGKAIALFDATPDEIFRVVTAYDRYREFAPRVVSSQVIERRGDESALVFIKTNLPWPVSDAWVYARFATEQYGTTYRVRFWQVKGSLRRYAGSILIEPWNRWKSAVTYELVVEPDSIAPKRLINGKVEDAVARYVHALRQHVNNLHTAGLLHPQRPPDPDLPMPLAGRKDALPVEHRADAEHR